MVFGGVGVGVVEEDQIGENLGPEVYAAVERLNKKEFGFDQAMAGFHLAWVSVNCGRDGRRGWCWTGWRMGTSGNRRRYGGRNDGGGDWGGVGGEIGGREGGGGISGRTR